MMHRTTLLIPPPLKLKIEKEAHKENISMGELIRKAIEKYLNIRQQALSQDSFLSSQTFFEDEGPTDGSVNHDIYLYGQNKLPKKRKKNS